MSMFHELMMRKKGMPERYQEVDYIESTGTQWIDTGIQNNDNNIIQVEFIATTDGNPTICGGYGEAGYYSNTISASSSVNMRALKTTSKADISSISLNVKHSLIVSPDNVVFDGNIIDWVSDSGNNKISNIFLFRAQYGSTTRYGTLKMCHLSIRNSSNVLVRNFVPVYDTLTNKYGMWESVQGKFYGNDGTGDFKGSIVGYTVVGSPTITDGVVSGFSATDYLDIPYSFPFLTSNNWKIIIKATTTYNGYQQRLVNGSLVRGFGASCAWSVFFSANNNINDIGIINSFPYFKMERKGNVIYLSSSADGITYTNNKETDLTDVADSSYIKFGNASSQTWAGQLFIKDCLIYKDGKLWFNGQPA